MTPEQAQAIAELRTQRVAPKQIARKLGLSPSEVSAVIKRLAEEAAIVRAELGESDPIAECLVNSAFAQKYLHHQTVFAWDQALVHSSTEANHEDSEPNNLSQDTPLAVVMVARQPGYNRYIVCSYLVDPLCLGVKDTMPPRSMNGSEYQEFKAMAYAPFEADAEQISLEQAQAIVFSAVEYASNLGFKPHPDFESARTLLGEWDGELRIECGRDGKPFFINGPYDDVNYILATLNRNVGAGNFHYLLGKGEP